MVTGTATTRQAPASSGAGTKSKKPNKWARPVIVAVSLIAVGVGWWITVSVTHDTSTNFGSAATKPLDGLTIFAVFFVAAAAIERLLEPIAGLLPDKADLNKEAEDKKAEAEDLLSSQKAGDQTKAEGKQAEAKAATDLVFGQTIGFWALATIIAIITSALLKLYLPYVVGIGYGGRAFQILATGLVIGGGTKPLHELVGYMTAAKEAKEDENKDGKST